MMEAEGSPEYAVIFIGSLTIAPIKRERLTELGLLHLRLGRVSFVCGRVVSLLLRILQPHLGYDDIY